jgi:hypothetical protein
MEKDLKTVENIIKTLVCESGTEGAIERIERLFEVLLEYNDCQSHLKDTASFYTLKNHLQELLRTAKKEYNLGL